MTSFREQVAGPKEAKNAAMRQILDIIMDWKPVTDVFALKYYMFSSALLTSGSAAYINAHYRKVVKLRHHAFLTTLIPVIVAPSVVGGLLHHQLVQRPLLLETFKCPVCLELRGGMVQMLAGFAYPLLLAPMAAMQFAVRLYTYPVPDAKNPKNVVREIYKITKPVLPKFYMLAGLQIIVGMAWTHWELYNLHTVLSKMTMMEEAVKEHHKSKSDIASK